MSLTVKGSEQTSKGVRTRHHYKIAPSVFHFFYVEWNTKSVMYLWDYWTFSQMFTDYDKDTRALQNGMRGDRDRCTT